jgi:hypothetical protein
MCLNLLGLADDLANEIIAKRITLPVCLFKSAKSAQGIVSLSESHRQHFFPRARSRPPLRWLRHASSPAQEEDDARSTFQADF